jgi:parallel beta-helix repeat protein
MPRKIIFKAVALMLLAVVIGTKCNNVVAANPGTIVVPSPEYETIQKAINAASPGDVIEVTHGTYYENLIVNTSVSIIGEDRANTVIDGGGKGNVVNIIRSNVTVSGFTIQNGKQENNLPVSGISIRGNSVVVNNTLLRNNYYGLQLTNSSNCKIFNNIIMNSSTAGIYIHAGSSDNVFFQNTIENNVIGLYTYCPSNTFYHNNFINNTKQCSAMPPVILDNGVEGNYWSDYEGSDTNLDGIGDSQLATGFFTDRYPLMGIFTNFTIDYEKQSYFLSTICNSTISNFEFDESNGKIGFDVIGRNGTVGFCRIAMPVTLIQNKCIILLDGNFLQPLRNWTTSTYGYRCFLYNNTGVTRKVTIEFELPEGRTSPSFLVPVLVAASLVAIVLVSIILMRGSLGKEIRSKFLKRQSKNFEECHGVSSLRVCYIQCVLKMQWIDMK